MLPDRPEEKGFTIVEIAIAMVLLAVGVLGFVSAMVGSEMSYRTNRELATVNAAITSAFETFREAAKADFDGTLTAYSAVGGLEVTGTLMPGLTGARLTGLVIRDEPGQIPLVDLNGDGDMLDSNVDVATIQVAVVQFTATWRSVLGPKTITRKCLLARGDV